MSSEDFWPIMLLIAAIVFLIDIFIRRVTVHFYWVMPALAYAFNRIRGIQQAEVVDERLARLRNRQAAVASQLDQRRAADRFDTVVDEAADPPRDADQIIAEASAGPAIGAPPAASQTKSQLPQTEEETYTERLLAAKKKSKKQ